MRDFSDEFGGVTNQEGHLMAVSGECPGDSGELSGSR